MSPSEEMTSSILAATRSRTSSFVSATRARWERMCSANWRADIFDHLVQDSHGVAVRRRGTELVAEAVREPVRQRGQHAGVRVVVRGGEGEDDVDRVVGGVAEPDGN